MYRYSFLAWTENGDCLQFWNCNYYDPHHLQSFLKHNPNWVKILCYEKTVSRKQLFLEQIIREI